MASNEDDEALALLGLALIFKIKDIKTVKRKRKKWCKRWLSKRKTYSHVKKQYDLKLNEATNKAKCSWNIINEEAKKIPLVNG